MNKNFTPKQKKVWDFIKSYTEEKEYPPSLSEIQEHMDFKNISQAWNIISRLKEKGFVEREPYSIRGISVITKT